MYVFPQLWLELPCCKQVCRLGRPHCIQLMKFNGVLSKYQTVRYSGLEFGQNVVEAIPAPGKKVFISPLSSVNALVSLKN